MIKFLLLEFQGVSQRIPQKIKNVISWIPRTQKTDNQKCGVGEADNS